MPPDLPILRRAQIDALADASRRSFLDRLEQHVCRVFPAHAVLVKGRRGRRFMESCIRRAASYGIREARAVARFTDLVVALGADFDEQPRYEWIREILASDLGDTGKMYLIYKKLPEKCPGPPVPPPPQEYPDEPEDDRPRPPILVRLVTR